MLQLLVLLPLLLLAFLIKPGIATTEPVSPVHSSSNANMAARTPVYFISHGGPNIMFEAQHPAHQHLAKMGKEITQTIKPKAVVVFSAHWQAGRNHVEVNTQEVAPLIYEYASPDV